MVWYAHLLKNFPEFDVVHAVKGFDIVKAEVDGFLELSSFFDDPMDVQKNQESSRKKPISALLTMPNL